MPWSTTCLIIFYTGGFDSGLSRFLGDNSPNNWFGVYNRVTADQGFQYFIHDNEHSMGTGGTASIDRTGPFNNGNQNSYNHSNPQYLHQDLIVPTRNTGSGSSIRCRSISSTAA